MSWKDTISKNLIKSVEVNIGNVKFVDDMNNIIEVKTVGKCYNCHNDINHSMSVSCDGKCYMCYKCLEIQHLDEDNKIIKGHNVICKEYISCDYCIEVINADKSNFIEFIDDSNFIKYVDDDFIFDKEPQTLIKHNDNFYHYECFCEFLGTDFMNRVCNICKIYSKDIDNMRDINNNQSIIEQINVCIECYYKTNIRECYNNGCNGQRVVMRCCYYDQCKDYAQGCKKCISENYGGEYCDWCR